ncbi:hypothetical protein COCNU_07G005520 [Cocos nucifera]|uniref:Uncharacterized protein n=1 Tax=Cocos nucifera TaxID=13894 RepID=A0A8K0N481_COCNU|nr:hypothetical protein COCNU_07G005520 [Cocos nucifera]
MEWERGRWMMEEGGFARGWRRKRGGMFGKDREWERGRFRRDGRRGGSKKESSRKLGGFGRNSKRERGEGGSGEMGERGGSRKESSQKLKDGEIVPMDPSMQQLQQALVEIETEAEHLFLARNQLVENDRLRNRNREALTVLRSDTFARMPFHAVHTILEKDELPQQLAKIVAIAKALVALLEIMTPSHVALDSVISSLAYIYLLLDIGVVESGSISLEYKLSEEWRIWGLVAERVWLIAILIAYEDSLCHIKQD